MAYVLHACDWKSTEIANFQILPREAKSIDRWRDKHEYWATIADGIKEAVKKLREQRPVRLSREGRRGMGADR